MRKIPIQPPRARVERSGRKLPIVDLDHWSDLGEIAGREDLVRGDKIGILQRGFYHGDAVAAQKLDHPLPGDAVQEGAIWRRRVHGTTFRHEHVGIAELCDVAEHVQHQTVLEAARGGLNQRTRIINQLRERGGQILNEKVIWRTKQGALVHLLLSYVQVAYQGGHISFVGGKRVLWVYDITALTKHEGQVAEQERQLREILDYSPAVVSVVDEDGRLLFHVEDQAR